MQATSLSIRTEPQTKAELQKIAKRLGVSVNELVNRLMHNLIKSKTIPDELIPEVPNARTRAILKRAKKNRQTGNHSPVFNTGKEAAQWLKSQGI